MASVRLKRGSSHWFACYRLPTGAYDAQGKPIYRRVQRSTGTTDETRALQLAISFERAAVLAAEKNFTEQTAHRFLAEIRTISAAPVAAIEPIGDFLPRWLASHGRGLAPSSRERYKQVVDDFISHLGARARAATSEITPREIAAFRDAEQAAGKSASTVNKTLGVLGTALDAACIELGIEKNAARGLNLKGGKRSRQKRRPFTFEQFTALVRVQPDQAENTMHEGGLWRRTADEWRTFLLLGGYTGGRQQDIARLTWEQVDLAAGCLTFERQKNADTHWIPLHPSLATHLRALHPAAGAGYVMPKLAREERRAISNTFRRSVLPTIGIRQEYAERTAEKGKGRRIAPYSFHSLRHSLSTWLASAGVEESMRMQLVGHEDEEVNRGYTHTELVAAAEALAKVPSVTP